MAEAFSTLSEMTTTLRSPLFEYYQGYGPRVTTHVFCDALESYTPGVPGQYNNDSYIAILTNPGTSSPSDSGYVGVSHPIPRVLRTSSKADVLLDSLQHIITT